MPDSPPSNRRSPLPPEEFRPAAVGDYLLFIVGLLAATAMSVLISIGIWLKARRGDQSFLVMAAFTWSFFTWIGPAVRAAINWRIGVLAGLTEHSYVVRKFWQVQWVMLVAALTVPLPLYLLMRILCGRYSLL